MKLNLTNLKYYCFVSLLAAMTIAASSEKSSGVEGTVTVNSRVALPGVTVQLSDLARDTQSERLTNASGYYLFDQIRPGDYSMWVDAESYGCILVPRIAVHYGERVRQNFNFETGKRYGSCDSGEAKRAK